MNIFIIPGDLSHLARISDYLNDRVCGILIHKKMDVAEARVPELIAKGFEKKLYTLNSLIALAEHGLEERDRPLYLDFLQRILSDPRAQYLATRSYFNSAFNNTIAIEKVLVNSILIIRRTNPSCLVSSSTPHSMEAWVFAKCFEFMNFPVYILERTPINDRAWIYRGLDEQVVVLQACEAVGKELTASSRKLLSEQRHSRAGARDKDGFYLSRMDLSSVKGANSNKWWSYRREIAVLRGGRWVSLPVRILALLVKRALYKSYREVAVKKLPENPFIIYFMHYQPERSSLPEGLFHVQQWTAIRLLSWLLPKGWTLLVREHPTTWLLPLDLAVRTTTLFREIAALENTQICSMDVDTFEIIDKCTAVATLTGSVGFQALLRNKPVIAFGLPAYKDHPACFAAATVEALTDAIGAVRNGELREQFSDDVLTNYLLWVEQHSISADHSETDWLEARLKNFTELYRRLLTGNLSLQ